MGSLKFNEESQNKSIGEKDLWSSPPKKDNLVCLS